MRIEGGAMARRYSLMRCRDCGFPRLVSLIVRWNDNGTITQVTNRDFRVVIQHFGFLDSLFANIETRLGVSIGHIAFEAQRNACKAVIGALYEAIPGTGLVGRFDPFKRLGVGQFNKLASITGQCHSETVMYVPGKKGIARVRNPFHLNLMAAIIVGAFETLEGVPFDHSWEEEGPDTHLITIVRAKEKPEIAERMALERRPALPGDRRFDRCPRCRVPRAVAHLKWAENDGTITDTRTGARVIMLDGYMITTVFREMAKELGDEVNEILVDAQRELTLEQSERLGIAVGGGGQEPGELEGACRDYLNTLAVYGQGNPVLIGIEDESLKVTVENPYEIHILAGTILGLYEAFQHTPGRVAWERPKEGAVSYTVEPA